MSPTEQVSNLLARMVFEAHRSARTHEAEPIHDLRVSIRRFLQALRTFRRSLPRAEVKRLRRRLRRTLAAAAEVRDRDIALEFLQRSGVRLAAALRAQIAAERKQSHDALAAALIRWERRNFSSKWRARLNLAATNSQPAPSPALLEKMAKKFFQTGRKLAGKGSLRGWHRLRLRTKRFRYTMELFPAAYGPAIEKRLGELRNLQQLLGQVSDCEAIRELLRGRERVSKPLLNKLEARSEATVADLRKFWEQTFAVPAVEQRWLMYLARYRR